jgi:glyoxylase-like metal-dependent hydrolase (beta-lactamase superfamily II)
LGKDKEISDMPIFDRSLSRRGLLTGTAALAAYGLVGGYPALAKAPMQGAQAPSVYRFKLGAFEGTVISDGPLLLGEAKPDMFKGMTKDAIDRELTANFLAPSNVTLEQNALIINTGDKVVLFDTGVGTAAAAFGNKSGRLLVNLKAAGIDAKDVDAVVVTHAHPDHCWGLIGAANAQNFPNAQIYMTEADLNFWTDESKRSMPFFGGFIDPTRAALLPHRDRMVFVKDGQEILPGIHVVSTPGHTVGHTSYMIASQGQMLFNTADIAHHHVLVVQNPKVEFAFDTDPKQGAATRIRMFDMLAAQRTMILAYHFPWPGIGHISTRGDGFHYTPEPLQTVL